MIDLNEAKRLRNVEKFKDSHPMASRAEVRVAVPKPEQEKQYLFYYTLWTFVSNGQYKTLLESEAKNALKMYPAMGIYYYRLVASTDRMPAILKGRKVTKEEINGVDKLHDKIYQITGVSVPESDLMTMQAKAPLINQLRAFNKKVAEQAWREKWTQETRERFMACLKSGKSEKECEGLCNIKLKK